MRQVVCDKCRKVIKGANFGRKWLSYKYNNFSIIVKAGSDPEPHLLNDDLCQKCIIEILTKGEEWDPKSTQGK